MALFESYAKIENLKSIINRGVSYSAAHSDAVFRPSSTVPPLIYFASLALAWLIWEIAHVASLAPPDH
jgi:hypothetical protein